MKLKPRQFTRHAAYAAQGFRHSPEYAGLFRSTGLHAPHNVTDHSSSCRFQELVVNPHWRYPNHSHSNRRRRKLYPRRNGLLL
jgi:hypothetical protein